MFKGQVTRAIVGVGMLTERGFVKRKQKVKQKIGNSRGEHLISVHPQNRQKSVQNKKKKPKQKLLKPKKIRFLTEDVQKSINYWLEVPSNFDRKGSAKHSSCSHDDAYELTRTFKKHKKPEMENKKSRKQSEQIETLPYEMASLFKIKIRSPKKHSLSSQKQVLKKISVVKTPKKSSKAKPLPKTSRNSHATPECNENRFLSPEMIKHQSSYCFQSDRELENHAHRNEYPQSSMSCNCLLPPKRHLEVLFDSELSEWKGLGPKKLLGSTVDLLN